MNQESFKTYFSQFSQNKGRNSENEKKYTLGQITEAIFWILLILGTIAYFYGLIFIRGPELEKLKLDEENDRLLDREMLRSVYAHLHNEERTLENQLIKKIYMRVQSSDNDDDDLQVKSNAEKILKVIGK